MAKRYIRVTHPDGTVSKRQSDRDYLFAIEVGPIDPARWYASHLNDATQLREGIAEAQAKIDSGKRLQRPLGFTTRDGECREVRWASDKPGYGVRSTADGRSRVLLATAQEFGLEVLEAPEPEFGVAWAWVSTPDALKAQTLHHIQNIVRSVERAERAAEAPPKPSYNILSWHSTGALADKALASAGARGYIEHGYQVRIVPTSINTLYFPVA